MQYNDFYVYNVYCFRVSGAQPLDYKALAPNEKMLQKYHLTKECEKCCDTFYLLFLKHIVMVRTVKKKQQQNTKRLAVCEKGDLPLRVAIC